MVPGWLQILIVVMLIVLLFGRGKISEFMGDLAKGIKSFKKGMSDEDEAEKRSLAHDHHPTIEPKPHKQQDTTKVS